MHPLTEFMTVDFHTRPVSGYLYSKSTSSKRCQHTLTCSPDTEWPYYVLDALPIVVATIVFNIIYPASYLPRDRKETLDKEHHELEDTTSMAHAV